MLRYGKLACIVDRDVPRMLQRVITFLYALARKLVNVALVKWRIRIKEFYLYKWENAM